MRRTAAFACIVLMLAACATFSPRSRIADRLVELGLSKDRADCLADDLDDRLDRDELNDVAEFLTDLNDAESAGGALDALLAIDRPRVATAIAGASLACAIRRN